MKCNAPIVRQGKARAMGESDEVHFCQSEARWYHATGCGSQYRCTRHTYRDAYGRACSICGNPVVAVTAEKIIAVTTTSES